MVISSLVIETFEEDTDKVIEKLSQMEGVEVHERVGTKLVVTVEAETVDDSADVVNNFMTVTGVLNTGLVYVNFEDDPSLYPETAE